MKTIKPGEAQLTDFVIETHVGSNSFKRGQSYFNKNLVKQSEFHERNLQFTAKVQGSLKKPYDTSLELESNGQNTYKIISSECSCPVGYACKHVAALAFKGRSFLYASVVREADIKAVNNPEPFAITSKLNNWEKELNRLYDQEPEIEKLRLGLLFELVIVDQYNRFSNLFNANPLLKPVIKLGIRPASWNPINNKWVVGEINWKNIRYPEKRFNEKQQEFLCDLWMLYMSADSNYSYSYYNERYLFLDDFNNSQLLTFLLYGQDVGVTFINGNKKREIMTIFRQASATLTLDKTKNGDLSVNNKIYIDNQLIPVERIGFIGVPATMVYVWSGDKAKYKLSSIELVKLDNAISEPVIDAIKENRTTIVPKEDIARFTSIQYPKLARKLEVRKNHKLDIELPKLYEPKLSLNVKYHEAGYLVLNWAWVYRVGNQTFNLPLYEELLNSAVTRVESSEKIILKKVETICNSLSNLIEVLDHGVIRLASSTILKGSDMIAFLANILPQVEQLSDLQIQIANKLPDFLEFTDKPTIEIGMNESSTTNDWFDLSVVIKLNEEEVPFNELFTALVDNEDFLILKSGSYFRLDHPELDKLHKLIIEARSLQDKPSDNLRLSPFQASLWEDLVQLGIISHQADAWNRSVKGLLDLEYIPKVPVPKNLNAELRQYQLEGYQWLYFLWEHSLGGILADDMGLGKTLQTIALILKMKADTLTKNRRPVLIVAPTSVAVNWESELKRFAPSLKIHYQQTTINDSKELKMLGCSDIVLSTYNLFRLNFEIYEKVQWSALVLDEAQFVKNHQSKSYQCARKLNIPFKLALTGTPLENNLMELWSLLSITASGLFPSPKRFNDFYASPIEKEKNYEVLAQLRRRVRPLMLRRTKEQISDELPPKIEQTLELELSSDHKQIYDTYLQRERQRVLGLLGDMDKNRFMIFKSITTLRMLSLDARLVDPKKYKNITSTKLDGFFEQLEPVLSEGHKALVFSQFTSFLGLLRQELDRRQISYNYLDGSTKKRAQVLEDFKKSNKSLFLISLKAGGFGLNLTEADYCFLLDPWWNPAVEQQAVDRTHRIGQNKQVIVYRLISKGTIEEKVMALKDKKSKLFKSIFDSDSTFAAAITTEDIKALFE